MDGDTVLSDVRQECPRQIDLKCTCLAPIMQHIGDDFAVSQRRGPASGRLPTPHWRRRRCRDKSPPPC